MPVETCAFLSDLLVFVAMFNIFKIYYS